MVIQVRGRRLDASPESLEEFFSGNPEVGIANLLLAELEHTQMWREEVLFIKQRQQATSDYRENKKVRWIGSHAALTCHIAVMRHVDTGVASIGHFDNFCCWQFGDESSAHRDGIAIMLDEILHLSPPEDDTEKDSVASGDAWCGVEVTVVGGYEDERGDAAKNSLSLLRALHDDPRRVEVRHFCVGPYNTRQTMAHELRVGPGGALGPKTAVLKGIALDLKSQTLFPAIFDWAQFSDFDLQIKDKLRVRLGGIPLDTEEHRKTDGSTFKPKSLRNRAKENRDLEKRRREAAAEKEAKKHRRRKISLRDGGDDDDGADWEDAVRTSGVFRVQLKPTGVNENSLFLRSRNASKIMDFRDREKERKINEL